MIAARRRPLVRVGSAQQPQPGQESMRIGIFGGSFDPVHIGHLWIAEAALETLALDQIRWIPTATSPLKPDGAQVPAEDRLQMVTLAVSGCEQHLVDDCELRRGQISYTVNTLQALSSQQPEVEWFLIVGADSLTEFRRWRQPERILQLATLAVVGRGRAVPIDWTVLDGLADEETIDRIRRSEIQMPLIELSSTDLRTDRRRPQHPLASPPCGRGDDRCQGVVSVVVKLGMATELFVVVCPTSGTNRVSRKPTTNCCVRSLRAW